MDIRAFCEPKSIAVVGASSNRKKLGWQILSNLKKGGYSGKIYPVNLKSDRILGLKAYPSLLDIDNSVDLALIVIPKKKVIEEVRKCAERKIKNIIIISAGFKESDKEGKRMEEKIIELAKQNDLNILGPNCLGLINSRKKINLTFSRFDLVGGRDSRIACLSQSGAIGSSLLDWFSDKNLKLTKFISLGNQAVLKENDFFYSLRKDKNIDLVVAYLEEISEGQEFLANVTRLSKIKPVIIVKAGRSQAGSQAALSHTGSLSGSRQATEAALERSGAIVAKDLNELFDLLELWTGLVNKSAEKIFKGAKLYIVSNAGGPSVISVDIASDNNLEVGAWPKGLKVKGLPATVHSRNPLDILGDASSERYQKALDALLSKKDIDVILAILTPQTATEINKTAEVIIKLNKKHKDKFIVPVFIGEASLKKARRKFIKSYLPIMYFPHQAIFALAKFSQYFDSLHDLRPYNLGNGRDSKMMVIEKVDENYEVIKNNYQAKLVLGQSLDYLESIKLLKKYQVPTIETKKFVDVKQLKKKNFPLVLKAVGPQLLHKTDKKGVMILIDAKQLKKHLPAMKRLAKGRDNYLVYQPYVEKHLEMIVGFRRDSNFGPLVMVGWGGIYIEAIEDVAWGLDDIDFDRAIQMIKSLKSYKVLTGLRTGKTYDIKGLAKTLVSIAKLARENVDIQELDINPLLVGEKKVIAVDIRIII